MIASRIWMSGLCMSHLNVGMNVGMNVIMHVRMNVRLNVSKEVSASRMLL